MGLPPRKFAKENLPRKICKKIPPRIFGPGRDAQRWPWRRLLPLVERHVIAAADAGVELARTADLLLRILDHLAPLADPADGAGDGEQHGEHRGRETHRLQRDAR